MPARNPLSNLSRALFGYHFEFAAMEEDQRELHLNYKMSPAERLAVKQRLNNTFHTMVRVAKEMFQDNCVCTRCGEKPLVAGSRHQHLSVVTNGHWVELENKINNIDANLITVTAEYIYDLKPLFEALEASYLKDKVAKLCARKKDS